MSAIALAKRSGDDDSERKAFIVDDHPAMRAGIAAVWPSMLRLSVHNTVAQVPSPSLDDTVIARTIIRPRLALGVPA